MAYEFTPNHHTLAASLTPQQFELMLRAYVQRQLDDNNVQANHVLFSYTTRESKGSWTISSWSSEDTKTKGELLFLCSVEHSRRKEADAANTLLLLEYVPVDEPNAPQPFIADDIPF